MKVGIFLGDAPPDVGGGHTIQQQILRELHQLKNESRHSLVLLTLNPNTKSLPMDTLSLQLASRDRVELKWRQLRALKTRLQKFARNPELRSAPAFESLFHTLIRQKLKHHQIQFILYLAPSACLTMDIPYLTIVWDLQHRLQPYFPEVSGNGEWSARERFFNNYLQRASVIVTGTAEGKAEVERFYGIPPNRIRILPHPTPQFEARTDLPDTDVLQKYNLKPGYVFYPAQFWPHKNHVLILKALKALKDKHNLTLHAVFAGSDKGNLEYVRAVTKQLELLPEVHFVGFVPREDLAALYRDALALTYVTFFGPENLPPLEAFSASCPVIATNVAGTGEQLGDAALLVDPVNEHLLADAIYKLHSDAVFREDLRRRGSTRALRFTGRDFAKGLFAILDEFEAIRRCWPT